MLVKDVMTEDVLTVRADDMVDKAARMLVDNKISGLPVVDEQNHVLGIITENDLMIKAKEFRVPYYLTLFDSIIFLENPIRFNNDLKKYTALYVKEAMTRKVITVREDSTISDAVALMQKHRINRVPVVRHNQLIGIVTRNDILKAMVKTDG